jgi:hypothetical protein
LNSVFKDIKVTNSDVNFLQFTGYKKVKLAENDFFYLDIVNFNCSNNTFKKSASVFLISQFIDNNPAQIRIRNSVISDNAFESGGGLITIKSN